MRFDSFLIVRYFFQIGFGDYCMKPIPYTSQLLPRSIANVTTFYLECIGTNPLSVYVDEAYSFVSGYTNEIKTLQSTTCPANSYLSDALTVLQSINGTLNTISSEIVCPPIQSQLSSILETGLCTQSFQGIYTIWLGQYMTVSVLFAVTILISLLYQYYYEDYVKSFSDDVHTNHNDPIYVVEGVQVDEDLEENPPRDNPSYEHDEPYQYGSENHSQHSSQYSSKKQYSSVHRDNYI